MPSNDSKKRHVRKKIWKPKTKTGCITCRVRRVKCDEANPSCLRCTSTGRKCDGYTTAPSSPLSAGLVFSSRPSSPPFAIPELYLESIEEQEAFYFFCKQTSIELSGFFDSNFWQCELLQASHSYPAIRYAATALGAMHRKLKVGKVPVVPDDVSDRQLRFALMQSNRAIQELLLSPSRKTIGDKVNMMTHCVLFNCLACIQGHQSLALEHLRSGLRILREVDEDLAVGGDEFGPHPVSLCTLRAIFVNMDVQARAIMSDDSLAIWEPQPRRDFAVQRTSFKNILQARAYFESTFNDVLAFMQSLDVCPPTSETHREAVIQELTCIRQQFNVGTGLLEDLLSNPAISVDMNTTIGIRLIHDQIKAWLEAFSSFDFDGMRDLGWGMQEDDLRVIVELASQLLQAPFDLTLPHGAVPADFYPSEADRNYGSGRPMPALAEPVFFSGSGVLSALFAVVSRARDPLLRRRAVALLLSYPRREGMWDSVLAGRIAWEAIMLEEADTYEEMSLHERHTNPGRLGRTPDIPDSNRIRDIAITYTGLRVATVEFRNVEQYKAGLPGFRREIAW
ncbi:hypothetical protein BDV96DRAFT_600841 [Lophiotrema nucula]|uniref:Zn(2)-C6 fungal-type domain-containing protein n=1 Tax=Lophiotrema nucula TaxID=690887 RepID=A0A6A5Z3Q7_9PLEO|nr:hypothetical protein BDV96DRAFT_600841 [Lophiotrema nucula]